MCVSGSSNESISKILNIDIDAISDILSVILNFNGWTSDLDYSPYSVYKEDPDHVAFVGTVVETHMPGWISINEMDLAYSLCKIYSEIEDKLDQDWV